MSKYRFQIKPITTKSGRWGYKIVELNSGKSGNFATYTSIATISLDGKTFGAVTAYFEGTIPHEQVFEIVLFPTELLPEAVETVDDETVTEKA